MDASLENRLTQLVLGLSELMRRPRIARETVADAAARASAQLGTARETEFAAEVARVMGEQRAVWAEELARPDFAGAVAAGEERLAQGLNLDFDGIDLVLLGHYHRAENVDHAAALMLSERLGLREIVGRDDALFCLRSMLGTVLAAAHSRLEAVARNAGRRNQWREDDQLEEQWQDPEDELPLLVLMEAIEAARGDSASSPAEFEQYLRSRLSTIAAERSEVNQRIEALGPHALLRWAGADDAAIARTELKSSLQEEIERRPRADRLERLMIAEVEEVFLMALTRRFEAANPSSSPAALADFLRDGVERRWQLIQRLEALGNASRWAQFVASQPLEVADFEAVEAVIRNVQRRVEELAAAGESFLSPDDAPQRMQGCSQLER